MKTFLVGLTAAVFALPSFSIADVVVSIRYFKVQGTSHYHLFLYSDEGKLIRQLTQPEDAHDVAPEFTKDGSEILFTRMAGTGHCRA